MVMVMARLSPHYCFVGQIIQIRQIITSSRAELIRTGLTIPSGEQGMSSLSVSVTTKELGGKHVNQPKSKKHVNRPSLKINSKSLPGQALTGESSKVVNTLAELSTIIVLRLTALVEVLDSRDRVERTGDVQVPVPNVVRTCLDNLSQLPFVFLLGLLFVVCFLPV